MYLDAPMLRIAPAQVGQKQENKFEYPSQDQHRTKYRVFLLLWFSEPRKYHREKQ